MKLQTLAGKRDSNAVEQSLEEIASDVLVQWNHKADWALGDDNRSLEDPATGLDQWMASLEKDMFDTFEF